VLCAQFSVGIASVTHGTASAPDHGFETCYTPLRG